jgi:hypothetical protein
LPGSISTLQRCSRCSRILHPLRLEHRPRPAAAKQ